MDTSEYLPMFLAEAREHLQELNLAIVRIEEVPDDRETIDGIFRIAHTLKGMCGTMGFVGMAALTHAMEDVLESLRQQAGGLSQQAVDVLLECLDALAASTDSIDGGDGERLDAAPLVARLHGLATDAPAPAATSSETPAAAAAAPAPSDQPDFGDLRVVHVRASLPESAPMPGVRAFQLLQALTDHGEVLRSAPLPDEVDDFAGSVIEAWVATEHELEAVEASVRGVPELADFAVTEANAAEAASDGAAAASDAAPALAPPNAPGESAEPGQPDDAGRAQAAGGQHGQKKSTTVRVDADRLDQLMHLMGEVVVSRSRVEALASGLEVPGLPQAVADLARSSQALQAMVMQVRMVPVEAVFLRFPRLVRDLSTKLSKKVDLQLVGKETELDRTVVDAIGDPMVHLVRNSLDHGLEPGDERLAAGKPETGTLTISAAHQGGNVVISVADDGRGIDPSRVARKAAEQGLIAPDVVDQIDTARAIELLFTPGFSTAEATTDISGRGVGMDAVRNMVRELGGEVWMTSELGVGTMAQIRLPLTLAIMVALLVRTDGVPLAVPLDRVERTIRLGEHPVRSVLGQRTLVLRDGVLPIVDLAEELGYRSRPDAGHAVIVRGSDRRFALAVDELVGQFELVTRPLPEQLGSAAAATGGAVLSNGEITLIVDCDRLAPATGDMSPALAHAA